jgi:hypothetical protein
MVMIITNLLGAGMGLPWENAAAWERISPYNDVAKLQLLLFDGRQR